MIDEAGAQRKRAGNGGIGEVDTSAFDDAPQDGRIELIDVRLAAAAAVPEQNPSPQNVQNPQNLL